MNQPTPSPDDLRAFVLVARHASFTKAAQQLQLPRATVSSAVLRLESRLGARLLQRTTRRVQLTHEGEELLARSARLLDDLDDIAALFQQRDAQISGRLRVDMPLGMATEVVLPKLHTFYARHPAIQVDVCSTDRRVDVIGEGYDCVIRGGAVVDESLAHRPLGAMVLLNVVGREYAERYGVPLSLADLDRHLLVNYQPNVSDAPAGFDYVEARSGRSASVPMKHIVTVNNSVAYTAACEAGLGIAQLPSLRAGQGIRSGAMVEVLPEFRAAPMPVNLLFPHRRNIPKRVRVFADWVQELAAMMM
ncbi:LysR family transcriptional regulator [Oxalobacteraceae bacterium A2-2]